MHQVNDAVTRLVRRIHASPAKMVIAVTGGGSGAISSLLDAAGASRSVIEAIVPYAGQALIAFLGRPPEQFCSEPTGRAMAMAAYQRAADYEVAALSEGAATARLGGIGLTASLASDRPKQGAHRIHSALQTGELTLSCSLELLKGGRDRSQEQAVAAAMVLNMATECGGVQGRLRLPLLKGEQVCERRALAPRAWQDLLAGRSRAVEARPDLTGSRRTRKHRRRLIFPGAYHPRHDGHRRMALVAQERTGMKVEHEISLIHVDKAPLDFCEMEDRAAQFDRQEVLWFTRAASFVEKAVVFPGATFIVGADVIERIADLKYYGGEPRKLRNAIREFAELGSRFLVFGRVVDGKFRSLSQIKIPRALRALCDEVPVEAFRVDLSSTQLRAGV